MIFSRHRFVCGECGTEVVVGQQWKVSWSFEQPTPQLPPGWHLIIADGQPARLIRHEHDIEVRYR